MERSQGKTLAWIAVTMAVALAAVVPPASATPYGVTTTADTVNDANCQPSSCTLRQAVNAASANPGLDSISLPVGSFPIELEFGQLVVNTTAVDISGAGMGSTTLIASRHSRVLQIQGDSTVTVANLTITHGKSPAGTNGGGINVAAGANTLTLDHVIVADNDAQASGATS